MMLWRELFLRTLIVWGVAAVLFTEGLSVVHAIAPGPLAVLWLALIFFAIWKVRPARAPRAVVRGHRFEIAAIIAIAGILATVAATALASPPNSADAMAYHMPRVVYWAQARSVEFFPTPYFNQIMLQPFAEYAMLQSYVLTGGDRLVNFVQFMGCAGSVAAVSLIANALGLGSRAQAFAALFCATLPNGILQASGAKNDYLLALWIAAAIYFALRRSWIWMGLAIALALGTKATAYLFLPPILCVILWRFRSEAVKIAGATLVCVAVLDGPQYYRNLALSGSILGYDSAHGDGVFRWRNEHLGWQPLASNFLRHSSEQLGGRSERWNQWVFDTVVRAHEVMRLDSQDPDTTFRWSRYAPPRNANHEADANNRWHLLIGMMAAALALLRRRWDWVLFASGIFGAFLLFCFYLKWQPFLSRLELPLFVMAATLAAFLFESLGNIWLQSVLCLFLLSGARLPLLQNWTRPLTGPNNLFVTSREFNYFRDMGQWNNRESYLEAVQKVSENGCADIGLDISENQLEYPFQVLVRARNREARFSHVGVQNASRRFGGERQVCAVLCLDCAGNPAKIARYQSIGKPINIGKFLLFLKPR